MSTDEGRQLLQQKRLELLPNGKFWEDYFLGIYDATVKKKSDGSIIPSSETLQERDKWFLDQLTAGLSLVLSRCVETINFGYYDNFITKLKNHEVYKLNVLLTFLKKLNEESEKANKKTEKFRKTISKIQVMFRKKRACVEI